jgi:hypothetical protein
MPAEGPSARRARPAVRQAWVERLQRFARSGLSVPDFCAAEGVSAPSFYSWRRRLVGTTPAPAAEAPEPRLLPVRLPAPAQALEIALPGGAVVRVPPGADLDSLRALLRVLGVSPC